MTNVKRKVLKALTAVEKRYDAVKFNRRQRRGLGKLQIMPFIGYGTPDELVFKGRVLRDKNINAPMDTASIFTNLSDMYKRFQSDEIPGAVVRARLEDNVSEATTNEEGFFEFHLKPRQLPPNEDHTYLVALELVDYPGKGRNPAEPARFEAQAQVIVPPPDAEFGIISDVDDTVLRSNVSHILSLVRNTFLENAHTRLPFEGVAKLYQALRRGKSGANFNPIFYVSSSTWNIYDVLHDFFIVREIPLGALFLSEYNVDEETFIFQNQRKHKVDAIETVLNTYPHLSFILIGDSSEKDPIIYHEIALKYPERIRAIYIRAAEGSRMSESEMMRLVGEVEALGVPMLLVQDSYAAAKHAADRGFIHPDALPTIREERNEDLQAPTPVQQALKLPATPPADVEQKVEQK
jgi:phosphatidate phosphatase APP1